MGGSASDGAVGKARPACPTVSIVIPAKDEARNLATILPLLPVVHEVILVDGGSVDRTVAVAKSIMPGIKVIDQTRTGKGNALVCGFLAATGDIIVMFDADASADPDEIPRFVDALVAGADFAKGSRFLRGGGSADISRMRAVGNRVLNLIVNLSLGTRYTDLCYGFNAFWTDVLRQLDLPAPEAVTIPGQVLWGDGFEIETVINCRAAVAGLRVQEVPSYERCRAFGASNLRAVPDGLRVLRTIGFERRQARAVRLPAISGDATAGAATALAPPAELVWPDSLAPEPLL